MLVGAPSALTQAKVLRVDQDGGVVPDVGYNLNNNNDNDNKHAVLIKVQ